MKMIVCCGKGGVGKSTSVGSLAMHYSDMGLKTAVIDTDGGQSMSRVLGCTDMRFKPNSFSVVRENLQLAIIDPQPYRGVSETRAQGGTFDAYLGQFPADLGIVPLADMMNEFFGVPTDTHLLQQFTQLVGLMDRCHQERVQVLILDVEPTAGLQRLLSGVNATARSLRNLQKKGRTFLLAVGAAWPDIAAYLKSDYIRAADVYADRMERMVWALRHAQFLAVCIPEVDPVLQTYKVRSLVEASGGAIAGYIINNARSDESETEAVQLLPTDVSHVWVRRSQTLHRSDDTARRIQLMTIGRQIDKGLALSA